MTDEKITPIGIGYKQPPSEDEGQLRIVRYDGCNHRYHWVGGKMNDAHFFIREGETEVECGLCGTKLDPMFVLRHLASEESQWQTKRRAYQDEMKRLNERMRTKCQHCERMTRIKR